LKKLPGTIAIDGPAASGKSTIGKLLAQELDYIFVDTGIMYRAVTWATIECGIDVNDEEKVTKIAQNVKLEIRPPQTNDGRDFDVLVDGTDVTWLIREAKINNNVSLVSMYKGVRSALTNQQRIIAEKGKIVMVGRDIGTVVLPNAELKIYLEASLEERAKRRFKELHEKKQCETYESVLRSMKRRDEIDSKRDLAPLVPAEDAVIINTDGKGIKQVMHEIINIVKMSKMQKNQRSVLY